MLEWQLMDSSDGDASLHSRDTNSSFEDEADSDDDIDDLFEIWAMAPVVVQLVVVLDRLGHEGNGVCIERNKEFWGVSHGTIVNYTKRVLVAIEERLVGELKWPGADERRKISEAFEEKGFLGFVKS
ncbi:hypothetical protein R1flu_020430 [Riccia fluitans]|uniref:Uncharacterized protein n=1 Tax=Riccia fluitans TaxID=41844 RepID=A0ABD1ZLX8_9MARC